MENINGFTEQNLNSIAEVVIDTIDLFRNIKNNNCYKYSREIIVNLFRTSYQTETINKQLLQSLDVNEQGQLPKPLYIMSYANNLAFGNSTRGNET